MRPFQSKAGRHGTLYRFRLTYRDAHDPVCPVFDTSTWAYSAEHAEEKFFDSDDDGWRLLSVEKIREPSGVFVP
jgi:hypothetical protein